MKYENTSRVLREVKFCDELIYKITVSFLLQNTLFQYLSGTDILLKDLMKLN